MAESVSNPLDSSPTWTVAAVFTVMIAISLTVERCLHHTGQYLERNRQRPLYEALQKVKEELMLLGFISLLLTAFQGVISTLCLPKAVTLHMRPCKHQEKDDDESSFMVEHVSGMVRRVLSEEAAVHKRYCASKGKDQVPFMSIEAVHQLHIFIFALAIVHVTSCVLTVLFGGARIRQWKQWEDAFEEGNSDAEQALLKPITDVCRTSFIRRNFMGWGKISTLWGWMCSFFEQFYGSITESEYKVMRWGFIKKHCKTFHKFNFHKYMIRSLEDDFKHVFGIRWYLWMFVMLFLLLNIEGLHTYFWMAFIPFFLLLALGTKLEHVVIQLAHEIADKNQVIEGKMAVTPSDEHFWLNRPSFVLFLIHFILFQNSFEMAYFFWILVQYGTQSCLLEKVGYIVPRLFIGIIVQVLCSYSTLPLYAIIVQMGSKFKKAIFDETLQEGLDREARSVRGKTKSNAVAPEEDEPNSTHIEMEHIALPGGGPTSKNEIEPANGE